MFNTVRSGGGCRFELRSVWGKSSAHDCRFVWDDSGRNVRCQRRNSKTNH